MAWLFTNGTPGGASQGLCRVLIGSAAGRPPGKLRDRGLGLPVYLCRFIFTPAGSSASETFSSFKDSFDPRSLSAWDMFLKR